MWNDTTVSWEVTWFESGSKDLVMSLRFQARFTEVPLQNLYSKWLPHRLYGPTRQALHNALHSYETEHGGKKGVFGKAAILGTMTDLGLRAQIH